MHVELHLYSSLTSPLAVLPNSDIDLLPFKFLVNLLVAIVDIDGCDRPFGTQLHPPQPHLLDGKPP